MQLTFDNILWSITKNNFLCSLVQVGKISSCNQVSKKIRLVPVPEHPFDLEKTDKALYGEDGSLEVL